MRNLAGLAGFTLIAASSIAGAQTAEVAVPGVMPATQQADQSNLPDQAPPGVVPASSASERRLTPEQVDKVLADAARRNKEIPVKVGTASVADEQPCPTQPHGEMGVGVGTGGYSSVYGTTVIPIGCHSAVAISVESSQGNGYYYRGRRH